MKLLIEMGSACMTTARRDCGGSAQKPPPSVLKAHGSRCGRAYFEHARASRRLRL